MVKVSHRLSDAFLPNCVLIPNRNPVVELYRIFPQLQPGEKPVNGFTCALHKDILLQGRIVICTNCICFHSNIFGYETRLIIYFKNVLAIRREKTAFVVPNAISIRTVNKRYLFCSFLSRESVFKLLMRIWKTSLNAENQLIPKDIVTTEIAKTENSDCNHNRLLISSSASCEPPSHLFTKNYELYERPHSSPPSLSNLYTSSEPDLSKDSLREKVIDTTPTDSQSDLYTNAGEETSTEDSEYEERKANKAIKEISLLRSRRKLIKSNTFGDLRELASIGKEIGIEKIGIIGRNLVRHHQKCPINLCPPVRRSSLSLSSYIKNLLKAFIHFIHWLCMKNTAMFLVSFLFLALTLLSLSLMVRINNLTNSFQQRQLAVKGTECTSEENLNMQHIYKYQDSIHNAQVQRMKDILSLNIQTVNEVQEALHNLREKLEK